MKVFRQAICCAAFCAVLAFSYALATSSSAVGPASVPAGRDAGPTAQSRFVGQPLRFTNPFLVAGTDPSFGLAGDPLYPSGGDAPDDPDGFDLGDADASGQILRYISAAGGYLPYTFTTTALLSSQIAGGGPTTPQPPPPLNSKNGKLSGVLSGLYGSVLRFNVLLTDFIGTERTGMFKLNLFPSGSNFRFAVSQLPTGQQGSTYYTNIAALGGVPPVRFDVVPSSIQSAVQTNRLEFIGLSLSPDGTLTGRPAVSGQISFTVRATDATGMNALSRTGTTADQAFRMWVEPNGVTSTEMTALSCSVGGHTAVSASDSFSYSGVLDGKGDIAPTLAGSPFVLRVGGSGFSGTFDDRGKVRASIGDAGKLTVNYSPSSGRLSMKLSKVDLTAGLGAQDFTHGSTQNVVIAIEFGSFRTAEVLVMPTSVRNGKYRLNYRLGGKGNATIGGSFQILTVKGTDAKLDGEDGDKWLVRFLGVPRAIETKPDISGTSSATVRIGGSFEQTLKLSLKKVRQEFKATNKDPGVWQFLLDPKSFVHRLQTNILTTDGDTAIPIATGNSTPDLFSLGLSIQGLSGEAGRVIVPSRSSWAQR